jgi:hypothetical protein
MKTKMYLSIVLAMILVVTPFLAFLPNAYAATTYHTVLIEPPFDAENLARGETISWGVSFSNLPVMPKMDIMYVVDTTGSMSGVRSIVAATLGDFTADLMEAGATDIHFGAAFFGDIEDDDPWFGIELPLGDYELSDVRIALSKLHSTYGGDEPEDSLMAYMSTIAETKWREDSQHVIVLVTDSPPKIREDTIGGYPVTLAGARSLSDEKNIQTVFMTHGIAFQLVDFSRTLDITEHLWTTQLDLRTGLTAAVIPPESSLPDYLCEARIESISYASDNMPSADVSVSITSATSFILGDGETKQFTFTATGSDKPARYNDATIAEIGYYIDGNKVGSASQYLRYFIEADKWIETNKDDAYGTKIASNAQSYNVGSGVIFYWDQKQKDEGVLVIPKEFFNTHTSLTIVVKSSNEYRKLTVADSGSYDVTKWTDEKGALHNINTVWIRFDDI